MKAAGGKRQAAGGRQAPNGKRWFYILLISVAVIGIGTLSYLSIRPNSNVTQIDSVAPIANQGHVIGSDSAPIEVVEFGDFECPACMSFATISEPDVRARLVNTGVIRFRFMDFPISGHANTMPAHRAAWCAGEQGKFWEMHDVLYQNQDRWNSLATSRPDRAIRDFARPLGLNMDQFESCVSSRKFDPQIRSNSDEGARRGVGVTPTFFIGTRKVTAAIPYDTFKRYVEEARAEASKAPSAPASPRQARPGQK